jgi:hypothetical protein
VQVCDARIKRSAVMRVKNTVRLLLLGGLMIMGSVAYQERDTPGQSDPAALTSLVPSPVEVSVLSARSS